MLLWYIRFMRASLTAKISQPVFWVAAILSMLQGWALTLFLQHGWKVLTDPYPADYGEGAVLDQAMRLFQGHNIYPASLITPPYVINVYPPIYLVGQILFIQHWGPSFWYGRAISFISTLLVAIFIIFTLKQFTRNWPASIVGGLTFLAIPYTIHWAPLFRVDMLALAFSWAALYIITRWPQLRWSLVLTVLLLTAAIYTRQSYALAAPLTVFCWLWAQSGLKRALTFAALLASLVLGIFLALNLATNGGFLFNTITILGRQNVSSEIIWYYAQDVASHLPLLLIAAGALVLIAFAKTSEKYLKAFFVPYLVAATISALTIGKPGSNVNYLLELVAALSLAAALLIFWLQRWRRLQWLGIALLAVQTFAIAQWTQSDYFPAHYAETHPENGQLMRLIQQTKGPVLTDEYIGLLLLDHRPVYIQPFDFSTLAKNGTWDQQPFLDMLDRRMFEVIIIYNPYDALVRQRWTKQMLQHIRENYVLTEHIENNEIYRRKP